MLSDILKTEAARLLGGLDDTPEPKRRPDLRRNKHKRIRIEDGLAFKCTACGLEFDASWDMIAEGEETDADDIMRYLATCDNCGAKASPAPWYAGIFASWKRSKSDPELAERRTRQLDGTRTPEQNAIARFNGYLHGAYAKSKHLFPNVPGSRWCYGCDIDPDYCRSNPAGACVKAAEAYAVRHMSIESGDPTIMNRMIAINQANADMLFNMMTQDLLSDGVKYSKPEYVNSESGPVIVRDDNGNPIKLDYVNPVLPYWQKHLALLNQTPMDTSTVHRTAAKADDSGGLLAHDVGEEISMEQFMKDKAESLKLLEGFIRDSQRQMT